MKCMQPGYIKNFQCDGKICGARCCRDWRIVVDEDTYDKFSELENTTQEKIFQHTEWVEDETEGVDILVLKLREDGVCSLLGEDCLCKLQKNHGEEFLSAICQSYPRVTYKIDDETFEQSMTLTCPLAAKLILLSETPITFEEVEKVTARAIIGFKQKISRPVEEFINVQMQAVKILQDRNFSINRRLKNLCELFYKNNLPDKKFNLDKHAQILSEIFIETYGAKLTHQQKKELRKNYLLNRENILRQTYEKFGNIFENYLVNEFFMRCYPCAYSGGEFHNVKVFITAFRFLEFSLVLTAVAKKNMNVEDLTTLIYSVNDTLDHSQGGMDAIINFANSCNAENFVLQML